MSLRRHFSPIRLVLFFACLTSFPASNGDLVYVEYYDVGVAFPESNGGPRWTGIVDTVSNKLLIQTWQELPGHGADFWVPTQLPMLWTAYDSGGNVYEVPETFGTTVVPATVNTPEYTTATIDSTFAFIAPKFAGEMSWEDISGNPVTFGSIYPPTRVGWGGYAQLTEFDGVQFVTAAPNGEPAYDEKTMPRLPVSTDNMLPSTSATIKVTDRTVNPAPVIVVVPETASWLRFGFIAVALAGCAVWRRRWARPVVGTR